MTYNRLFAVKVFDSCISCVTSAKKIKLYDYYRIDFPHQLFYRPFSHIRFEGCYDGVLTIFKDFKILHVVSRLQLGWEPTLY